MSLSTSTFKEEPMSLTLLPDSASGQYWDIKYCVSQIPLTLASAPSSFHKAQYTALDMTTLLRGTVIWVACGSGVGTELERTCNGVAALPQAVTVKYLCRIPRISYSRHIDVIVSHDTYQPRIFKWYCICSTAHFTCHLSLT